MKFKPRIFISSTFDLINLRKKLSNFYKSIGAEPLLYEENLTPSINRSTYRKDILNADFALFIFDKKYGSETDTGMSGTHEEWLIANKNNIPSHVYIRYEKKKGEESSKEEELKDFISEEIDSNYVSYYFFKNENDLLKRIKETSLTIAHDIIISQIERSKLEKKVVRKLSIKHDYDEALPFLKTMEEIIHRHQVEPGFDITRTTIIHFILSTWGAYSDHNRSLFIDEKLNDLFHEIFVQFNKIQDYQLQVLHAGGSRNVYIKNIDMEISYEHLVPTTPETFVDYEQLREDFKTLVDIYNKFKEEVLRQRNENDLYFS